MTIPKISPAQPMEIDLINTQFNKITISPGASLANAGPSTAPQQLRQNNFPHPQIARIHAEKLLAIDQISATSPKLRSPSPSSSTLKPAAPPTDSSRKEFMKSSSEMRTENPRPTKFQKPDNI
jgi:hypothetical protein